MGPPCKNCLVLPMCVNREEIRCSKLFAYIHTPVLVNGIKTMVSYTKFIEAQQFLLEMHSVGDGPTPMNFEKLWDFDR